MSSSSNPRKRVYYRETTAQQRRHLFEVYEETGDVAKACQQAHVGVRTFYYWLGRFREGGYAALDTPRSRAPHRTRIPPTPRAIVEEVIAYKQEHPEAGYRSISDALRAAHDKQPTISPTQVRRILLKAGLVGQAADTPQRVKATPAVHAPNPEQTLNIDLCVVPIVHDAETALPATSLQQAAEEAFPPDRPDTASD